VNSEESARAEVLVVNKWVTRKMEDC